MEECPGRDHSFLALSDYKSTFARIDHKIERLGV
jgi:hypothetical protein